jgi:hypothetical protein
MGNPQRISRLAIFRLRALLLLLRVSPFRIPEWRERFLQTAAVISRAHCMAFQ